MGRTKLRNSPPNLRERRSSRSTSRSATASPTRDQRSPQSASRSASTSPTREQRLSQSTSRSASTSPIREQRSSRSQSPTISNPPITPTNIEFLPETTLPVAVNEAVIRQVALPEIPLLPKDASKRLIAQWISLVSNPLMLSPHLSYVSLDMLILIEHKFAVFFCDNPLEEPCDFDKLSKQEFCRILTLVFSDVALRTAVNLSLPRRLKNADPVRFSLADPNVENTTVIEISNIVKEFVTPAGISTVTDSMHLESVKVLNDFLPKTPVDWRSLVKAKDATTVKQWITLFLKAMTKARLANAESVMYGFTVTFGPNTFHNLKHTKRPPASQSSVSSDQIRVSKKSKPSSSTLCIGCGRTNHSVDSCHFRSHPDFNSTNTPWNSSANGKTWAKRPPSSYHTLGNPTQVRIQIPGP